MKPGPSSPRLLQTFALKPLPMRSGSELRPPFPPPGPWIVLYAMQQVWWQSFRCLQMPYLLLTRSLLGLMLGFNWWDVIDEHVLLGGTLMFDDVERLRQRGVRAVVNLCAERPDNLQRLGAAHLDYLWLPVLDAHPPTVAQIQEGLAWIAQHVRHGRAVYIHCAAGIGRSATLLACWYIYVHGMDVAQILRFIKQRRPQAALTRRQVRRLDEFAALLQQTTGKLAVE